MRKYKDEPTPTLELLDERACAFQQSIVFLREDYPNMAVMTYDNIAHRGAEHFILAKFVVGIGIAEPVWLTYNECDDKSTADNIRGGLKSIAYTNDGIKVITEIYPLMVGRDNMEWEGAALIKVKCEAETNVWLKFGNGNISFMHFSPNKDMSGANIDCESGKAEIDKDTVYITREDRTVVTAVKGNFEYTVCNIVSDEPVTNTNNGQYIVAHKSTNEGFLMVGFSTDKTRAAELANLDPKIEYNKIIEYYDEKLKEWYIKTPSKDLDESFMHAFLNVEYAWLRPYGWIESIQHWPTMWHMEHTAVEEWAGNYDRVRECLRSQMKNLFESGAIPDMCTNGQGRRDWGGNNQFFFREVDHYLKMTKDMEFALEVEPYMEKVLAQTFREYDPLREGVIAWGTQIGNQEDFESTPGKGAATGSEGVKMLAIMADFKLLLNKADEAKVFTAYSNYCKDQLIKSIWLDDLGRFAWYEDIVGEKRLDTTYHGISYPVIYDQIDDIDKVSSLDHLKHRLSGPEGEIYQSNHFGDHGYWGVPTWGMQCGSDMQPFATAAYAKVGMNDDAIKPLEFIAKRVCGDYQRGSWPETANEKRFAYFSPSAAVFSQAVIESIFGLSMDKIQNTTVISPCFPSSWDHAELKVLETSINYKNNNGEHCFDIKIDADTDKIFRWKLPPYVAIDVVVDGVKKAVKTTMGCGWFEAEVQLGKGRAINISITYQLMVIECDYIKNVACGGSFDLKVNTHEHDKSVKLVGVDDRCGVFKNVVITNDSISCHVKDNLLDKYAPYGWFGLINFARRTFALKLEYNGVKFDYPCQIVIMPKLVYSCQYDKLAKNLIVTVINNTELDITGSAVLQLFDKPITVNTILLNRENNSDLVFNLTDYHTEMISPGNNCGNICIMSSNQAEHFTYNIVFDAGEITANVVPLTLDESMLKPMQYWKEIGLHPSHGHMMQGPQNFMDGLFENHDKIDFLKSVPLPLNKNGYIPISTEKHRIVSIPLSRLKAKKIYILLSTFIDNHDVFSTVFKLELEAEKKDSYIRPIYRRDLTYPGQLDMGYGNPVIAGFATFVNGTDRISIPTMPYKSEGGDYPDTLPYEYPQRSIWCSNRAIDICNTVFNLIEIDLGRFTELKELRLIANEADAAGGIFAIAAHI